MPDGADTCCVKTLFTVAVLSGCAAAAVGCSSTSSAPDETTIVEPPPATVAPTTRTLPAWIGSGVFSVGAKASGGAKASIPAGRYTVELQAGRNFGTWYR